MTIKIQPRATIETITPDEAREILRNHNKKNRKVRANVVSNYARDMKEGRWVFNGDTLRFDFEGNLLDGQHRLYACIRAEYPLTMIVVRDLERETVTTMDKGTLRRADDDLTMLEGTKNATHLVATIRAMADLACGGESRSHMSAPEVHLVHKLHPSIGMNLLGTSIYGYRALHTPLSAINAINHILGQGEQSERFIEVMRTGIPAWEGCPAHAFRERYARSTMGGGTRMNRTEVFAAAVHAWNLFKAERQIKVFKSPLTRPIMAGWNIETLGADPTRHTMKFGDIKKLLVSPVVPVAPQTGTIQSRANIETADLLNAAMA